VTTSRSYSGVLIQLGDPSPGEVRRVDPNTSLPLVVPHDCRSLKVGNPDPEETVVGMLTACEQQWQITNYTRNATFVVENLEGGGEFIKIVPLWRQVTIPFELSRLVVPLRSGPATLRVFSPPPPTVLPDEAVEIDNGLREHLALDEQAKYFLVLVALCEPRLRSSTAVAPPAIPAVVERLRSLPGFEGLTRTAVNYHIDYLFSVKLREYFPDTDGPESRTTGKREKLVDTAIKYDLVRPEHLMLLPERRTRNPEKTRSTRNVPHQKRLSETGHATTAEATHPTTHTGIRHPVT